MATGLFKKNQIRRISFAKTRQSLVSQLCLVFIICFKTKNLCTIDQTRLKPLIQMN